MFEDANAMAPPDPPSPIITDIVGTFGATSNIVGDSSGAYYSLSTTPDTQVFTNDVSANNVTIETEADSIIDFSESNPFSESNY